MSRTPKPAESAARTNAGAERRPRKAAARSIADPTPAAPVVQGPATEVARDQGERPPRAGSKLALIVAQLKQTDGTTLAEMGAAAGWQPHTVRATLSGLKARGYVLSRDSRPDGARYRIAIGSPVIVRHEEMAS